MRSKKYSSYNVFNIRIFRGKEINYIKFNDFKLRDKEKKTLETEQEIILLCQKDTEISRILINRKRLQEILTKLSLIVLFFHFFFRNSKMINDMKRKCFTGEKNKKQNNSL